ncbi:hypothetical protein [Microbulbifer zhoushanensis]|uniref:hypothetical protein n=1 Tax=Microbulbifer zhoushanensis TaxID=2904254 RepID=UPI001F1C9290|nr:hypothetical protein [Microbulbifer zhoushanensis]
MKKVISIALLMLSSFVFGKEVEIPNARIEISDPWYVVADDDTPSVHIKHPELDTELVIFVENLGHAPDPKTLERMIEIHTYHKREIKSVSLGQFSGYFIPFELDDRCHANWNMISGNYILLVGYQSNCNDVQYGIGSSIIESLVPIQP